MMFTVMHTRPQRQDDRKSVIFEFCSLSRFVKELILK